MSRCVYLCTHTHKHTNRWEGEEEAGQGSKEQDAIERYKERKERHKHEWGFSSRPANPQKR